MYDVLRASYRFHCPHRPQGRLRTVALSRFRSIERLPGAAHPAVFRVVYRCDCGDDHVGLVAHDDLDYGPIAASNGGVPKPGDRPQRAGGGRAGGADPLAGAARQLAVAAAVWPRGGAEAGVPVQPDAGLPGRGRAGGGGHALPQLRRAVAERGQREPPGRALLPRPGGAADRPAVLDSRDLTVDDFHEQLWSAGFDAERAKLAS